MLLNAVIIILQEVLEAALLISVLLAIGHALQLQLRWLGIAAISGVLGAMVYQYHLATISEAFDYVGQEISNALMLTGIYLALTLTVFLLNRPSSPQQRRRLAASMAAAVSLGIIREGSEIIIYVSSFLQQDNLLNISIGGTIGTAIGTSLAALSYYTLVSLRTPWLMLAGQWLLALIAAAMLSQAIQFLIQADWLPAQQALWDSTWLISEESVTGHLLYAIAGYEATPGVLQVFAYLFAMASIGLIIVWKKPPTGNSRHV